MQLSRFCFILKLECHNLDNGAIIILYRYVIDAKSGTAHIIERGQNFNKKEYIIR